MAVLPGQPSISVSIVSSDGRALPEFVDDDADDSNDNVICRYIEATSAMEFGIRWEVAPPSPHSVMLEFKVDGKWAGGEYGKLEMLARGPYASIHAGVTSVVNGQSFLHKFAFAALDIDDSVPFHGRIMDDSKGIGEITVRTFYVKNIRSVSSVDHHPGGGKDLGKMSEKALKGTALSHQTTLVFLSVLKPIEALTTVQVPSRTTSGHALKSLLVVPRSPSPVPLEERDIDTLSPEEMRELLRRQKERDAAAQAVKQERGVKRERMRERSSTVANESNEADPSVIASKKKRRGYRNSVNEDGIEQIDLT
ncbi:hypothetical protein E8E13_009336 [Curvularia kusanoi]|uniref:DUF7918 domain-containing protein n=1 Tax=Curvularia kusanoi TaxID=90978 RepID=A0A9P4WBH8_CURKU|nr:hypothetical protein E8E13_009336 [Curvularia kusanoi]